MKNYIINDFLLFEEFCNLKCLYCGGFDKESNNFRAIKNKLYAPSHWHEVVRGNKLSEGIIGSETTLDDLIEIADKILDKTEKNFAYSILKLSGGEIFLSDNIVKFIKKRHKKYQAMQLLTNGVNLKEEQIREISELGNVYFQISLDGITPEANRARFGNELLLKKVLKNIKLISELKMGLEINCVLTKFNTGDLKKFVEYFSKIPGVVIFPRPVRGNPKNELYPDKEQIENFDFLLENHEQYRAVLPPYKYLERVRSILREELRSWNCYVPYFVMSENNYGKISKCTCGTFSGDVADISSAAVSELRMAIKKNGYSHNQRYSTCADCISQYEIFNLLVEGDISGDDVKNIPTFQINGVINSIDKIREDIF